MDTRNLNSHDRWVSIVAVSIAALLTLVALMYALASIGGGIDASQKAYAKSKPATVANLSAYAKDHGYSEVAVAGGAQPIFVKADGTRAKTPMLAVRLRTAGMRDPSAARELFRTPTAAEVVLAPRDIDGGACAPAAGITGVQVCRGQSQGLLIKITG